MLNYNSCKNKSQGAKTMEKHTMRRNAGGGGGGPPKKKNKTG